ncbi:DNA/RNA non-specific endonuclease [Tumebacillus sp. DT12]|uniref:DNA/RNA non-specific endonuclease n=1 Tax=Tumebacillus lacus TaxID=2995335 RepID=A0ABT3WZL6_9BACL|nr:DNA/RNA non-specific endonuclease [Tumebacillus lacus]MCX7569202.1 DNA/RNA non-specific endonuclease [Tumebacillus lacus]
MTILILYHKQTQSPWLPDEDRTEAARVYCEQAYGKLSADDLENEIELIRAEEERNYLWQERIQNGAPGKELIEQEGYTEYALKQYYQDGAFLGMAAAIAAAGGFKRSKGQGEIPSIPQPKGHDGSSHPPSTHTTVNYGDHYTRDGRKKVLKPNVEYTTPSGHTYRTDDQGRIIKAEGKLSLGFGKRNNHAQKVAGREDRLPDDDGGHLIASIFEGSGSLDNLVSMNGNLNKGEWKKLENMWAKQLDNGRTVEVQVIPKYFGDSQRPDRFEIKYKIGGGRWSKVDFENVPGGKNK